MIEKIQILSGEPHLSHENFAYWKNQISTAITVALANNDDSAVRMVLDELVKQAYEFGKLEAGA